MNEEAIGFWSRALKTLPSAESILPTDPDSSASRAYYAAFYIGKERQVVKLIW